MDLVVVTKVGVEGSRTSLSNVRCQRVSWRALGSNIILSTRSLLPTSFYKSSSHALPIDQGLLILLYNDQEWGLEHSSQVLASKNAHLPSFAPLVMWILHMASSQALQLTSSTVHYFPQLADHICWVFGAENRRSRNDNVGASLGRLVYCSLAQSTIHLDVEMWVSLS